MAEPSNAWSNAAYVLAGFGLLFYAAKIKEGRLSLFGVGSILLGLGSFFFHATGSRIGELVDVSAMYVFSALGLSLVISRSRKLSTGATFGLFFALWLASATAMILSKNSGIIVFAIQALTVVALEILWVRKHKGARFAAMGTMMVLLGTAYAIWLTDKFDIWCDPDHHFITGHAVWHVLGAASVVAFAQYHRQFMPPRLSTTV